MTMAGIIRAMARRSPDKLCIRFRDTTLTFSQLSARVERAADAAVGLLGLCKGDTAAIVARNRPEYLEVAMGLPEAGVPVATINARHTPAELLHICLDIGAKVIFADRDSAKMLAAAGLPPATRIIVFGVEYETLIAAAVPMVRPPIHEWEPWTVPYTSGTTGAPKGVILSHRSRILAALMMGVEFGCFSPDDSFLALTPLNHGAGMAFTLASVLLGGCVELQENFDAELVLRTLKSGRITGVFMVPTHFAQIFALPAHVLQACEGAPIKTIISNAAPLSQAMKERIIAYFGSTVLHEVYGSTEGGIVSNIRPADQLRKERCVGLAFPATEIKIVDDRGAACPPWVPGELFSRSPVSFSGYWGKEAETREAVKDMWVTVGDIAMFDDEGYLYIVDRKKDMVISGGVNIYPREIEEALMACPGIAEAAVIGVPDEKWGERLKAFIVSDAAANLETDLIVAYLRERIAKYKIPDSFAFVATLPRNANGKVLKTALRAGLEER
jgi:long-chain acyl-CoA synthetase